MNVSLFDKIEYGGLERCSLWSINFNALAMKKLLTMNFGPDSLSFMNIEA
jgi:hypothetical protein